jgi:hypothetical protein
MLPGSVGVVNILSQDAAKMSLPKDQHPVEAFLAHGANPAFGKGMRVQRLNRRADDADRLRFEHGIEGSGELHVAVVDKEVHRQAAIPDVPTQVTRLLGYPSTRRVLC